ncbi:MAG: hypothetical protein QME85_03095 [Candidatus Saccharicenans sp.]|nr:hypothetical protein [Candidatus Saccharicenans sp.]MDI6849530.1 hypothetical protein [Candidatus Saccharicenans sp.]
MKNGGFDQNLNKSSIQGVTGERRGERQLELSLPALVLGENAGGRKFKETTELLSISSEIARFGLKNQVKIGTVLKLSLEIPATAMLIHPLHLEISGQVVRVEFNGQNTSRQLVTLELRKKFQLQPSRSLTQ